MSPNLQYVALSEHSAAHLPVPEAILMDKESYQRSEEFKLNHIQPRVLQDWYANDAHLLNNWLRFAERFRPSREVILHTRKPLHFYRLVCFIVSGWFGRSH